MQLENGELSTAEVTEGKGERVEKCIWDLAPTGAGCEQDFQGELDKLG